MMLLLMRCDVKVIVKFCGVVWGVDVSFRVLVDIYDCGVDIVLCSSRYLGCSSGVVNSSIKISVYFGWN